MQKLNLSQRVPTNPFITTGFGTSNYDEHAGSYHMALLDAGIATQNIMLYSSIIPAKTKFIDISDHTFTHGAVMETIMSKFTYKAYEDGLRPEWISAGIAFAPLYKEDTPEIEFYLVVERSCACQKELLSTVLTSTLHDLYERSFPNLIKGEEKQIINSVNILNEKSRYATVLTAICFTGYEQTVQNEINESSYSKYRESSAMRHA